MSYKTKYYLKKEIDTIMNKLFCINQNLQLFKILSTKDNYNLICKQFPHTFSIILNSLEKNALIELNKLVCDNDSNSITIIDLIKLFENNNPNFNVKKYYYAKKIATGKKCRIYFDNKNIESNMFNLKKDLENTKKKTSHFFKCGVCQQSDSHKSVSNSLNGAVVEDIYNFFHFSTI